MSLMSKLKKVSIGLGIGIIALNAFSYKNMFNTTNKIIVEKKHKKTLDDKIISFLNFNPKLSNREISNNLKQELTINKKIRDLEKNKFGRSIVDTQFPVFISKVRNENKFLDAILNYAHELGYTTYDIKHMTASEILNLTDEIIAKDLSYDYSHLKIEKDKEINEENYVNVCADDIFFRRKALCVGFASSYIAAARELFNLAGIKNVYLKLYMKQELEFKGIGHTWVEVSAITDNGIEKTFVDPTSFKYTTLVDLLKYDDYVNTNNPKRLIKEIKTIEKHNGIRSVDSLEDYLKSNAVDNIHIFVFGNYQ